MELCVETCGVYERQLIEPSLRRNAIERSIQTANFPMPLTTLPGQYR
jgi:hypothetical protein